MLQELFDLSEVKQAFENDNSQKVYFLKTFCSKKIQKSSLNFLRSKLGTEQVKKVGFAGRKDRD